jgi:hypothetical protein
MLELARQPESHNRDRKEIAINLLASLIQRVERVYHIRIY